MATTINPDPVDPVFEVTFECNNCGATFDGQFEEETRVKSSRNYVRVIACDQLCVDPDCRCGRVPCEVCSVIESITIADRRPIDDD